MRYKKPLKISGELENKTRKELQGEWSPKQIVDLMASESNQEGTPKVSHETIHKHIYRKQKQGDKIYLKLRKRRKKRLKRLEKTMAKRNS